MKRCVTPFVIREIQIKTRTKYSHFTPARVAQVKKDDNTNVRKDVEQLELSRIVAESVQ